MMPPEWREPYNGDDPHDDAIIDAENHPGGVVGEIINDVRLRLGRVIPITDAPRLRRRREIKAWLALVAVVLILAGAVLLIEREA